MAKLMFLPVVLLVFAGCASPVRDTAVGWTVQAPPGPSESLLLVKGPTAVVAEVIGVSAQWGWRAIDRADSLSGSTFVLMAGPTSLEANTKLMDLLRARGLTHGPALSTDERFTPAG